MRVDMYTKVVLTIIAACLVWMCVTGAPITPVAAQGAEREPQQVVLVGSRVPLDTVLIGSRVPVAVVTAPRTSLVVRPGSEWYDAPLPVDAPRALPTRVTGVERQPGGGRWDALDVNVKEQPRKGAPGH